MFSSPPFPSEFEDPVRAARDPMTASREAIEAGYREHSFIEEIGVLVREGNPVAVIVPDHEGLRQGSESRVEEALRQAVMLRNHQLPPRRQVADYVLSPSPLPRTPEGRLDRQGLSRLYERLKNGRPPEGYPTRPISPDDMSPGDRQLLENHPRLRRVWEWLEERFAEKPLAPDARFQIDLEVDSLGWVDLTVGLARDLDIELSETDIAEVRTVRDFLRAVRDRPPRNGHPSGSPLEEPESVLTPDQRRWLELPSWPIRAVARFMFEANRLAMKTVFGLEVHGRERLPEEPFVLTPNHCSYLDPLAVFALIPYGVQMRTHWIAWRKIVRLNALTYLAHRAGMALPVDSIEAPISSLAYGSAALKRGRNLVWFPEGRRSPNGRLQPFQPGLGILLEHEETTVVPVRVEGTFEAWPAGQRFPRPHPISVHVGSPVPSERLKREGSGEDNPARLLNALRARIRAAGR